jgi:hypothetical protein
VYFLLLNEFSPTASFSKSFQCQHAYSVFVTLVSDFCIVLVARLFYEEIQRIKLAQQWQIGANIDPVNELLRLCFCI